MSVLLESVNRINSLKSGIEAVTGETYPDLTEGIQALKDGYGQGGGGSEELAALEAKIDESGVLDGTEQSLDEKVDGLIVKADVENYLYQKSSTNAGLSNWFAGYNGKKLPRSNPVKATICNNYAQFSTIEEVDYYLNFGAENGGTSINGSGVFGDTQNLKHVVGLDTSKFYNATYLFRNSAIETIDEPFDFSRISSTANINAFGQADRLKDVRFVKNTIPFSLRFSSPYLTDESIQSIVDGLADLTGGTTQTLTLSATVTAKLTEEQIATITRKNWVVA